MMYTLYILKLRAKTNPSFPQLSLVIDFVAAMRKITNTAELLHPPPPTTVLFCDFIQFTEQSHTNCVPDPFVKGRMMGENKCSRVCSFVSSNL